MKETLENTRISDNKYRKPLEFERFDMSMTTSNASNNINESIFCNFGLQNQSLKNCNDNDSYMQYDVKLAHINENNHLSIMDDNVCQQFTMHR